MTVTALIKVSVDKEGYAHVGCHRTDNSPLAEGVYEVGLLLETREATLGEIARAAYNETMNFDTVAARVLEAHAQRTKAEP